MSIMEGDWGYQDAIEQDLMYADMPEEYMEAGDYYGDDEYGYYYDEEEEMAVYTRIPFSDLLDQCVFPTLEQATSSLAPLLGICFAFRITYLLYGGECRLFTRSSITAVRSNCIRYNWVVVMSTHAIVHSCLPFGYINITHLSDTGVALLF